jgi:cytoskeletal protein RodZ
MATNTLSKNSISIIVALLLVIILSESKLFLFFTETYLGRTILILVLLLASYINKILGIVCVFIIIIMFNNNIRIFNYEGFETNSDNNPSVNSNNNDKIQNIKNKIAEAEPVPVAGDTTPKNQTTTTTTTNSPTTSTPSVVPNDYMIPSKINVVHSSPNTTTGSSSNANEGIEGFDLQSTENNIKRGKQSNSIPVNPYLNTSVDVAPYEGNVNANSFNEGFSVY